MKSEPSIRRGVRAGVRRLLRLPLHTPPLARADADAELDSYIESRIEYFIARGMTPAEARLEALNRLGGTLSEVRAMLNHSAELRERRLRVRETIDDMLYDIRYAARGLLRRRGFAAAAIACLAIGIGANATMFSVVDSLLLRPPAGVRDPANLLWINAERTSPLGFKEMSGLAYPDYVDLSRSAAIAGAAAYQAKMEIVELNSVARQINALTITPTFMPLLGARPVIGRFFEAGEDQPGTQPLVVLGYDFWQAQFAGETSAIGQAVLVGTTRYMVIGVAPRGFNGVERTRVDVFLPTTAGSNDPSIFTTRGMNWLTMLARSKPGIDRERIAEELNAIYHRSDVRGRSRTRNRVAVASPTSTAAMRDAVQVQNATLSVWLAVLAGIVLIIACANVASLLLTRAVRRRREISVRLALGVSRGRLVRMLMTESVLLAAMGGFAGLLIAHWGSRLVRSALGGDLTANSATFDGRVLLVTLFATILTAVACGIVPAVQATRPDLTNALKSGEREGTEGRGHILNGLLVGQLALTLVLLVCAGLFVQSLRNLDVLDLGFDVQQLLRARITPAGGMAPVQANQLAHEIMDRARALPGVTRVALATAGPFGNGMMRPVVIPGRAMDPDATPPGMSAVTPDFFATLGIQPRRGRLFTSADQFGSAPVAIVNEEMANRAWPGEDALGKCIKAGGPAAPCATVVGVVTNARQGNITHLSIQYERRREGFYVPLEQQEIATRVGIFGIMLYLRGAGDAAPLVAAVQRTIQATMPGNSPDVSAFETLIEPQIRPWRLGVMMFGVFGAIGMLLAIVGLYGVLAFRVSQRTREIGVRVALGASRRDVHRLVLSQGFRLAALGVGIGLIAALTVGRAMVAILFGVSPRDPLVLAGTAGVLLVVSAAASYLPALRATRIDPMEALRDL